MVDTVERVSNAVSKFVGLKPGRGRLLMIGNGCTGARQHAFR
jgi:hypothetical protein